MGMTTQFSVKDAQSSEVIGSLDDLKEHLRRLATRDYEYAVLRWVTLSTATEFMILNGSKLETWVRTEV